MSEWKNTFLAEIIEIIGGGTPKTAIPGYWDGDIPWLSVADFNTGRKFVSHTEKKITNLGLLNSSTQLLDIGDIIISARGTVGIVAVLKSPMAFNQSCYGIRAVKGKSINDYVYYSLKDTLSNFLQIAHGGVFDTITRDTFNNIEISLPPLAEQKAIASILSILDDKIDLLHRQNQTLEKMAETLFRQWFVEEAKEEWEEKPLGVLIENTFGGEWGKDNPEGEYKIPVYCIRGTDIADLQTGLPLKTPLRYIKQKKLNNIEPKEGDLILEISGGTENQSTGRIIYINNHIKSFFDYPLVFSNFCRLVRPMKTDYTFFLYQYIRYLYAKDEFFNLENGSSGIKNLDYKSMLFELKYLIPIDREIIEYNNKVSILFQRINQNKTQILTLTALRDTLLPKLMSGEVRVKQ